MNSIKVRALQVFVAIAAVSSAATLEMDSGRGQRVFESEACIQCHALNGKGGHIGPDLGRMIDRNFTPASLAGTMWNHAPTMWAAMEKRNIQRWGLDEQSSIDLFAYFYAAHFFDKPGDAARGKRLFHERSCDTCHGLTKSPTDAPPVAKWQALGNPIELTEVMWNHAGAMYAEFLRKKIAWPELSSQDLTDLLVYLRNLPGTTPPQPVLITTAGTQGEELFASKGCKACHDARTLLEGAGSSNLTLTDIAADLWAHAPRMRTPPARFEPNEMRELLSYLWANQFFSVTGNPGRGKKIFAAKHCATCHDDRSSGAPDLSKLKETVSGSTMVSVLWHHGPQMLAQMQSKKIKWPRFELGEMSDLIAYLNSRH